MSKVKVPAELVPSEGSKAPRETLFQALLPSGDGRQSLGSFLAGALLQSLMSSHGHLPSVSVTPPLMGTPVILNYGTSLLPNNAVSK